MEAHTVLRRPWTCRWARFGHVVAPGHASTPTSFWSCAHPARPDGDQLLAGDTCTNCLRWNPVDSVVPDPDEQRWDNGKPRGRDVGHS